MTKVEAKTVVVLKCAFFVDEPQLSKVLRMLWGETRIRELVGIQEHGPAGEDLLMAAEEQMKLRHGELEKLTLEECECVQCGHKEYYLTTPSDVGKACAKCHNKSSVFLPIVEEFMLDP